MSSPLSPHLLRAEGICKTYKTRTVVDQVSLTVGHGEIVGLLGPNGAGKTTSFYMVAGLAMLAPVKPRQRASTMAARARMHSSMTPAKVGTMLWPSPCSV